MRRLLSVIVVGLIAWVPGCAGVPDSSPPQALGTVERPSPKRLPEPNPAMDPDQLLREFLKATADPANRHLAARQFLTESASKDWDDQGSALLIDKVMFTESRSADKVSVSMQAEILGSLSDIGVFETGEGALPDPGPIELVQTADGWRINRLPNGVFLDWKQFQSAYKRYTLYFVDPTGKTVVPDPRYVAVSDPELLATELVNKLIAGPRPEMAKAVRNLLGPPLTLRGPVTRADGGKTGVGRGYGGARIDLEDLTTTDPSSRLLLAAQLVWTLARSDINGPYLINADGAPLDDRFVDGWKTTDVAATDPGAVNGASAGVHALIEGAVVALDGQSAMKVPGSFGTMADQQAATFSRSGRDIASVVVPPDGGASLWIGPNGGQALRVTDGRTLSRPSWALDDAVWVVVDGTSVVRVIREEASGQPARIPVDSAAVISRYPGTITELQISRDGTRAAMVIDGEVVLAVVEQTAAGEFALTYPRRIGFGMGDSVVALSWRTGDDMVVTRRDAAHPVSYVNLDGVNSDGPSSNLVLPMSTVAANPSAVYVADARGVLQLLPTSAASGQSWAELRPFMVPGAMPVMPG
ncbi:MAG: MtrAB system accessory protein LpqB [Actinomycetia bacterium]|nr:MtrAB system accessory protein LpqB [Actinomycetes bacterium]